MDSSSTDKQGWRRDATSLVRHYYYRSGTALCEGYRILAIQHVPVRDAYHDSPDNCPECAARRLELVAATQ